MGSMTSSSSSLGTTSSSSVDTSPRKVSELSRAGSLSADDLVMIAKKSGSEYVSKAVTIANFKGQWQLVERKEFSSPAQTYTFSSLNGDIDRSYKIRSRFVNAVSGETTVAICPNNVTSSSYLYNIESNNGTPAINPYYGANTNLFPITIRDSGFVTVVKLEIDAKTGTYRIAMGEGLYYSSTASALSSSRTHGVWLDNSTNITSIAINGSASGVLGTGSYIELWKLAQ